ncbi:unnamed protein product [Tuber aestivum]|uniref:Uncharacterized protein n=1 Tax=Tuber aestivum TaxID=59557 RepID=A0A292PVV2_9PEZI|nr:unnamed protein product [Tuber aestivum]
MNVHEDLQIPTLESLEKEKKEDPPQRESGLCGSAIDALIRFRAAAAIIHVSPARYLQISKAVAALVGAWQQFSGFAALNLVLRNELSSLRLKCLLSEARTSIT